MVLDYRKYREELITKILAMQTDGRFTRERLEKLKVCELEVLFDKVFDEQD